MKRITALLLTGAVLASQAAALASQDVIEVYLNDTKIEFDTDPEIVNDRTFVPLRAIVEGFGAEVDWDGETQSISITKDGTTNHLQISSADVSTETDGSVSAAVLDAPPYIKDERTMVPLRYISEGFGLFVDWNGEDRVITITDTTDIGEGAPTEFAYYNGFTYVPDFGKYLNREPDERSADNMYYYTDLSDIDKSLCMKLLDDLGFVQIDEMHNEAVDSVAFEKEDEQVVLAGFDNVFGVTVLKKQPSFTGEITYYEAQPLVPDYGAINGIEAQDVTSNSDGTTTYTYKSASGTERAQQMLTYLEALENEGYAETDKTLTTLEMTNETTGSYVILNQGTEDIVTLKITAK